MKGKFLIGLLLIIDVIIAVVLVIKYGNPAILHPAGPIAMQQKALLELAFFLAMVIILPVFAIFIYITRNYREGGKKSYKPDWTPKRWITILWWVLPAIIVLILSYHTWFATHELDPYKPLESTVKPVRIQVVALQWKWLFIYPEEHIATVNFIQFPTGTPLNFELTADAPMNSFWIPRLSGQIYAMTGMSTKIHMQADAPGDYQGSAAEISGIGFSGMRFTARASSQAAYEAWVKSVKASGKTLTESEYERLVKPTEHHPVTGYVLGEPDLYNQIIDKFMPMPHRNGEAEHHMMPEMNHSGHDTSEMKM